MQVHVSRAEAHAFMRWSEGQIGCKLRLPSLAEARRMQWGSVVRFFSPRSPQISWRGAAVEACGSCIARRLRAPGDANAFQQQQQQQQQQPSELGSSMGHKIRWACAVLP